MNGKYWIIGLCTGVAFGLFVSFAATFMDWHLNPGGIFRDADHAHWPVIWETVISWFIPVTGVATPITLLVLYVLLRRRDG